MIEEKIKLAITENRPYVAFPESYYTQLVEKYGENAVFKYSSQGKTYAVLNLFKTSLFPKLSTSSNGVKILPVDFSKYLPKPVTYVEQRQELKKIEVAFEAGKSVLLTGPKGTGKTLCLHKFAEIHNLPIYVFDCSEDMKRFDLIGRFTKTGNEIAFILGALPKAIEIANQAAENGYEGALFVLEEIACLPPFTQKLLNSLLDWRRYVEVEEVDKLYKLNPDAKLFIAATSNPSYYSATFELNEDLKSRFTEIRFPYPSESTEKKIIKANVPEISEEIVDKIILFAKETRAAYNQGVLSYCLSPRDCVAFCELYLAAFKKYRSPNTVLKAVLEMIIMDRFDSIQKREIDFLKQRILDIFGLEL